ncbi:Histidine kinase [Filimonas lacunae]|uniref:Histidine kinase n=1 Tax=Filimonas lacunae TaxID=477680 RepID=A0A173MDZ4_9BACT|nr:histidine kinase [Filimonas lacunae]BAV05716.1 two-component system sensor protein, no kinase domain [Filimonas lacunae]SIT28808.1 Histidine kinase [Filimonas lacunae]
MNPNRTYISILVHVLLWALLGFVLLTYTPLTWGVTLPQEFWLKQVFHYAVLITLFYVNARVLTPKLLLQHKTARFIMVILAVVLATMLLNYQVNKWTNIPHIIDQLLGVKKRHNGDFDIFMLLTVLLVLGISTSLTAIQSWQNDLHKHQQLQQQQVSSELSFLKAQIHPHFFFNTLNNIYSLTFIDIDTSRQALHKLSWMMRYLLYETQNDTTLLSNEIRFIKDYVELMKLRVNKNITVELNTPETLADGTIAPMLLLPFIENAFKHGISATDKGAIDIHIQQQGSKLVLEVSNNVFEISHEKIDDGGIGLTNTRRRLNLLYNNRYQLNAGPVADHQYFVHLELDLA